MDVVDIWTGRHANALLKALRLTNEGFADRLGIAVRTVAKWNADPELEPTPEMQQALDTVLHQASGDVKARFALILKRDAFSAAPANGKPSVVEDISSLVAGITDSGTSDEVVNQLARATASLAESHTQAPAKRILAEVLRLHRQTQTLLGGKQRLSQKRELFRIESDLLAHACLLFGDLRQDPTADEYGAAALLYAQEAGTNQAIAWSARAKTLRWQERFIESADMARQGFDCSPSTPIRVQLASQEANAAALLGDASRARDAQRRAEAAAETVVAADSGVSAWSFPIARQAIFALSVAVHTSDPDAALRAAAMADAGWASGVPQVPATWAQIRAGAGIAHLMKGSLDGAVQEVTPMLTLAPELRVATVTAYLENLDQRLSQPRFERNKEATALRQQIREFNSAALPETRPMVESR
jgi:hypothetical protein